MERPKPQVVHFLSGSEVIVARREERERERERERESSGGVIEDEEGNGF